MSQGCQSANFAAITNINIYFMKKRLCILTGLLIFLFLGISAQTLPTFSTEDSPKWYLVQFQTGRHFLADKGDGEKLLTEDRTNADNQQWQLIGSPSNFIMKSKDGHYLSFSGDRFTASSKRDDASVMNMDPSTASLGYDSWEIKRITGEWYLNQSGSTRVGAQLAEWWGGDNNNTVKFLEPDFVDESLASQPEFSTEENPVWYFAQFQTGGHYLADKGDGNKLSTENKTGTDSQQWQFIGNPTSFIMRSKAGNYISFGDWAYRASSNKADAREMTMDPCPRAATTGYWEIKLTTGDWYMNQSGGTQVGVDLGEYEYGDVNNAMHFIAMAPEAPQFGSTFYSITFQDGGLTMTDKGNSVAAEATSPAPVSEKLWMLYGNASEFQIMTRTGNYLIVDGEGFTTSKTPQEGGYSLKETGYIAYIPNFEIVVNAINGDKNRVGFGKDGKLTLAEANAQNSVVKFVLPADMTVADYPVEGSATWRPDNNETLWYAVPPTLTGSEDQWMEYVLPLGNGQLGAGMLNGVLKDQVVLNEKTLWQGRPNDNGSYGGYQYFGDLYMELLPESGISYSEEKGAKNYYRMLDLTTAVGKSGFTTADGETEFTREYLVSNPDDVVAIRISANKPGAINQKYTFCSGAPGVYATTSYADGEAYFSGRLQTVYYSARVKVIPTGGTMTTDADGITVKGADEVLVIMKGATDFEAYASNFKNGKSMSELSDDVLAAVNRAAEKGWNSILADHVADHKALYDRVHFSLGGGKNDIPTDQLVERYQSSSEAGDINLEALYYNYGRYLEIASSRGVDLPSNLQGIWSNNSSPEWNSDIHSNINVQMNYWPAEATDLGDLHLKFINYVVNMATNHDRWKEYARESGQSKGWTCYTENNIFGGVGGFRHNYVIANAWYCTHLWQHYRYTLDSDYLAKVFPTMWSAAEFWMERLKLDTDGTYVCPKEYSPEHGPEEEDGVAHAQQLVYDLFENTLKAIEVLGAEANVSAEDVETLRDRFSKLDRGLATEQYTGAWGSDRIPAGTTILREWKTSPYSVGQHNHRHPSHLMAVYPFNQITPESEYFDAAVNSMKLRGDESTGWSMAWKINLWARFLDGDRAHKILQRALRHSTSYGNKESAGGVYYNLFDSHSPFQIDGNFGAAAGVNEMLLQSQNDELHLLPALPTAWKSGEMTGLKAIGDFTVNLKWNEKSVEAVITNNQGEPLVVRHPDIANANVTVNGVNVNVEKLGDDRVSIPTGKGDEVKITMGAGSGVGQVESASALVTIDGNDVTVNSDGDVMTRIYDTTGRLLESTTLHKFTLNQGNGKMLILHTVAGDRSETIKVMTK